MKKTSQKATEKELATRAGISPALAGRKRRRGKTDTEIISEAQDKRDNAAGLAQPVNGESFADAAKRKESALASLRQLELRQKSGELIEVAVAERFVAEIGSTFRDALLSLPERFAAQLAAMTLQIEIRDLLRAEVRRILTNLPTQIRNGSEERRGQTQ